MTNAFWMSLTVAWTVLMSGLDGADVRIVAPPGDVDLGGHFLPETRVVTFPTPVLTCSESFRMALMSPSCAESEQAGIAKPTTVTRTGA